MYILMKTGEVFDPLTKKAMGPIPKCIDDVWI